MLIKLLYHVLFKQHQKQINKQINLKRFNNGADNYFKNEAFKLVSDIYFNII